MRTSATNRKLRVLLTAIASGNLVPRPEFQRRLVWTNKDKLAFIQTVLEGYPFPEIYIAAGSVNEETGEGSEMLVDGQQRITTLNQYFRALPDLRLDAKTPPYTSLQSERKLAFLEYEVVIRDLGKLDLTSIKTVFQRINATNYSLNAMEIDNARFDGCLKRAAEALSELDFFENHKIFSASEIKRMKDVRFCLSLLVTVMSTYFNRDEFLEDYLVKYNDEFEDSERYVSELTRVFSFINDCCFAGDSRIWKKADFFTAVVELHRALSVKRMQLPPRDTGRFLANFYATVDSTTLDQDRQDNVAKYYKAALQATNDRGSRIARGEVIQSIIEECSRQETLTLI